MESLDGANAAFGKSDLPNAAFARILVVGAGTMGAQIAMVCALAGHDTTVTDLTDDALDRARSQLRPGSIATSRRAAAPATTSTRPSRGSPSAPTSIRRRAGADS